MNTADADKVASRPAKPSRSRFLPERKPERPLWQWVLAVAFRIAVVPAATLVLVTGVGFCQEGTRTGSYGEFELMGFNRTDRNIASFYVEGDWGADVSAHGGGGSATCCTSLPRNSKALHVKWILDWKTDAEMDKRVPMETYEAEIPLPTIPKGAEDGYLQIYFFPGNRVGAAYTAHLYESDVKPQVTGRHVADTPYND